MTSRMTPMLENNEQFAGTYTPVPLGLPAAKVIVVTCLDHRIDPAAILGLKPGDAPVLRNAGGRVTRPVMEEIAFLAFLGKTLSGGEFTGDEGFEVAVIHHTQCGTGFLACSSSCTAAWRSRVRGTRARSRPHASRSPSGFVAGLAAEGWPGEVSPGAGPSSVPVRQPRWAATAFSTHSPRLCHRCQRSATWIAAGAPAAAAYNGTVGY
jgi:hypothetical protein